MGILVWLIIGAVAGWLASLVMGRNDEMGWLENIVVGIVGALVGGLLYNLLTDGDFSVGFDIVSLVVATLGAIIVLFIWGAIRGKAR